MTDVKDAYVAEPFKRTGNMGTSRKKRLGAEQPEGKSKERQYCTAKDRNRSKTCQLQDVLVNVKIRNKTEDKRCTHDLTHRIFVQDISNVKTGTEPVFKRSDTLP
jgi:hypothetical protein